MGDIDSDVNLAGMITNIVYFLAYTISSVFILCRYSKILDLFTVSLLAVYVIAFASKDDT